MFFFCGPILNKKTKTPHTNIDFTFDLKEAERMSKKDEFDPKSQKIQQSWTRTKHKNSQVNGQTEITLHNQLLRSAAKAKQF